MGVQEKKKRMDELEKSLAAVEEELSLKRTEVRTRERGGRGRREGEKEQRKRRRWERGEKRKKGKRERGERGRRERGESHWLFFLSQHSTSMTEQKKQFEALIEQQRKVGQ